MTIKIFNEIFVNKTVNNKSMIIVELILIISLFTIILFNNEFYDYYIGKAEVKENTLSTLVFIDDIELIKNNKEIIIHDSVYAYKIKNIEDENYVSNGSIYKIINISINDYEDIDNNYIEYKIVKEKDTLLNYFIKTLKGG